MKITVLGAGTPTPTPDRFGSSYYVSLGDRNLLFDCGPGTTYKMARAGLSPIAVDDIFFTHHHFDHNADFPAFVLTRWDQNVPTDRPLHVYGPPFTSEFVHRLLDEDVGAFAPDWISRVMHPGSQQTFAERGGRLPRNKPLVNASDHVPGTITSTDDHEVLAVRAEHAQPYLDSLAYRVNERGGQSVVVTGDTRPCPAITELARDADTLMMMCWDSEDRLHGTDNAVGCTSIRGAARTASEANVDRLVMVHLGHRLTQEDMLTQREAEAKTEWDGELVWADEFMNLEW